MTTAISTNTPPIQDLGVGSGIDVSSIVTALMNVNQLPLTQLQNEVSGDQAEVSAYGQLSSALSTFQGVVSNIANPATFQSLSASVANNSVASATVDTSANSAAVAGTHSLSVSQLAQNQMIATGDFSGTAATVGTGTITIQLGTWGSNNSFTPNPGSASSTITIDSSNDSVSGIAAAINAANAGVSASVINDGTGDRLVLQGTNTGTANGFKISVADSDGNDTDASGLSALAFDPSASTSTTLLQSAQNANLTIDGIAITSPTDTVSGAIPGVSLQLQNTTTTPTTISVSQNTSNASGAIQAFVNGYNAMVNSINSLTSYNSTTNQASTLTGDSTTQLISHDLQNIVASTINTSNSSISSLADLGITFNQDGTLALNQTTLNSALNSDPNAVEQIFANTGTASDSLVSYQSATAKTQPGDYALNVTQLATQSSVVGSAPAGLTITAGQNDSMVVTIGSLSAAIKIPAGTYGSAASLAAAVQGAINGTSVFSQAGAQVTVTANSSGALTMTSTQYGSGTSLQVDGNAGSQNLFGSNPTVNAGLDVAGTLDGVAFLGSGQQATGAAGTAVDGLVVDITGGSLGARGTVNYTQGIGAELGTSLTQYLDPTNGIIASATTGINSTITGLQAQETTMQANLAIVQQNLEAEFNSMDALVAKLQSTSSYLSAELSGASSVSTSSGSSSSSSSTKT